MTEKDIIIQDLRVENAELRARLLGADAGVSGGGYGMIKCDTRAKARCPFKNSCCGDEIAYFSEGSECDKFNQKILAPPPTNADRIRSMSDKELSEFFCPDTPRNSPWCEPIGRTECSKAPRRKCMLKWLQQTPEEDE